MIVKKKRYYYGLHLLDTAVTDTDPRSPDYLRIIDFPGHLTSGKNLIKLYGNAFAFVPNSILYVEVLDSEGKVVYSETPDFTDSAGRRLVIVNVTDEVSPGTGLITIVSTLRDELVPYQYRGIPNFKWQIPINIAKFESNRSEIIYEIPPEVYLETNIRPFVTASYRNDEETITKEYGDYSFMDFGFTDYIGDSDTSKNIFQKEKAFRQLQSFTSASISSFNRNNVFYLAEENYTAKTINRNYPDLMPGTGFFVQFKDNLIKDSTYLNTDFSSSAWQFNSSSYYEFTVASNRGISLRKLGSPGPTLAGQPISILAGQYYLISYYQQGSGGNMTTYLGYSNNKESGSMSQFATRVEAMSAAGVSSSFILQASNGGSHIWFEHDAGAVGILDDVRVYPLTSLGYDFKHESDVIGGYIKVHDPIVNPGIPLGYDILPFYTRNQIISGSKSYTSYIDFILQSTDAAVDSRLYYDIVPSYQITDPSSYMPTIHKVDRFTSNPLLNTAKIDGFEPTHSFSNQFSFGGQYSPATPLTAGTLVGTNDIYGVFYSGGNFGLGGLYKYNVITNQFTVLHNFPGSPRGAFPDTTPLLLPEGSDTVIYGTTAHGGTWNSGSIYKYNISTNTMTTVYSFGRPTSASGYAPAGPLMQASNGLLYGTTFLPVTESRYGVIYSFNTASRQYTVVHRSGSYAATNLVEYNGSLWGVTPYSGSSGNGSIFELSLSTGKFQTVFSFNGSDGREPRGLILGSDNKFYGITYTHANPATGGVIFSYTSGSGTITQLYSLNANTHGKFCERPLLEDSGYLYGVCSSGSLYGSGSVFAYQSSSNTFTTIRSFQGPLDGKLGKSSLIRVGNSFYGTTTQGGSSNIGTIFKVDRLGILRPYIERESGFIYHRNAMIPSQIPSTVPVIEDYPRWTGPITLGGGEGLYSVVQLEIRGLEPLSGDVSRVQLYAKPKGVKSEFVDLGVYQTTPVDVLLDTDYLNHVQYVDSPYRLTGYFKPIIADVKTFLPEASSFRDLPFLTDWSFGSITNSYFQETNFHESMSIGAATEINKPYGSTLQFKLTNNPEKNGLAYALYKSASFPLQNINADIWQQISYNLFSAVPFPVGMDTGSYNYYTGSSGNGNNRANLNSVLMYVGLLKKSCSITPNDIFALSPDLTTFYDPTGSNAFTGSYAHPLTFNGKLGWKTDTFLIPREVAITQSLYPAIFFEYNTSNQGLLDNTINDQYPHILKVSNISFREIGDRDHIRQTYWDSYTRVAEYVSGSALITIPSMSANTDVLMDSTKIDVVDGIINVSSSRALGYYYKNRVVFQTLDPYKFYAGVPYIISFNAVSKITPLNAIDITEVGDPSMSIAIAGGWSAVDSFAWNENIESGSKSYTFDTQNYGILSLDGTSNPYAGDYIVEVKTGTFTYSTFQNPTSLQVGFLPGTSQSIADIQPNSTYTFLVSHPTASSTNGPTITVTSAHIDPLATMNLVGVRARKYNYNYVSGSYIAPTLPGNSKLRVYGVNTDFGIPFADQLATSDIGEFIGELEQVNYYGNTEVKNFGRVEMEFEAETDGMGYIAFESDLGAEWYISEISVKPKDRVGQTPGITKLFVKVPNDLVNKVLTFKVEYLNDGDQKAPYTTILNDVVLSNVNEQQAEEKKSTNVGSSPIVLGPTNLGQASALDITKNIE